VNVGKRKVDARDFLRQCKERMWDRAMTRKEEIEKVKAAVIPGGSKSDGKSPGLIVKLILFGVLGLVGISAVQTFVMMNTDTPGASKDFAEESVRGLRDYCRQFEPDATEGSCSPEELEKLGR
jgi:cytoskeletal protein RodZ